MIASLLLLACTSEPSPAWTPVAPPMPGTEAAYIELLAVLDSLPDRDSAQAELLREQVDAGVVPTDVALEYRDLSVLLGSGIRAPALDPDELGPPYNRLFVLADAAVLEARVHLAYGEGAYAWGALHPVLQIAEALQAAGGGLLPWAVGVSLESQVLVELEAQLQTPYGLGREGERSFAEYLDRRRAEPALLPYAMSSECEATAGLFFDEELIEETTLLYDPVATRNLYLRHCAAWVAMLDKPAHQWGTVPVDLPSPWVRNLLGVAALEGILVDHSEIWDKQPKVETRRALLSAALQLRAGHAGSWPEQTLPINPATGEPVDWDGEALQAKLGGKVKRMAPAEPVWPEPSP